MIQLSIARRLWLPTLLILAVVLIMAAVATVRTAKLIEQGRQTQSQAQQRLALALQRKGLSESLGERAIGAMGNAPASGTVGEHASSAAKLKEVVGQLRQLTTEAENFTQFEASLAKASAFDNQLSKAKELKAAGDDAAVAEHVSTQLRPALNGLLESLQAFSTSQEERSDAVREVAAEERFRTIKMVVAVMILMVMGMAAGSIFLVRTICQPLTDIVHAADTVGNGDLTVHIDTSRQDELGDVMRSLAHMRDSLGALVGQVRQSTDNISVASSEVAIGNHDLSSRTEQTAANLQITAASMEELTATVSQSADAARQANQLAGSASEVARRGGSVVSQVVATMEEINNSSKKISEIITVIDGIAFQTNILALNAAVEAARAGEQGRGFAVVASEVRSLASRSAEAAKEIKSLIGTSVDRVEAGSRLVRDAGSTMHEIVASVQKVSDMISEITAAAAEQSGGITQVNESVAMLDQMTQQNAALVEEGAAAAESLKEQAASLAKAMERFKLSMR
jgi:methyl-accepting chemotaxis protein